MKTCKICNGPCGILGTLGRLRWYLCRDCGMQFSRKIKPRGTVRATVNK